jgi:hypothetical protein
MKSSKKASQSKVIMFTAIGIGAFAIIAIVLFSGFSMGTLTDTASNPSGPTKPPGIVLINDGVRHEGQVYGYTFSQRFESLQELPDVNTRNITAISTDNIVSVDHGSQIQFAVEGNPPSGAPFDSLSVTAYTEDGRPVAVLDILSVGNSTENPPILSFSVSKLQPGIEYILLSTATWLDHQNTSAITGYVYYIHRIIIEAQ